MVTAEDVRKALQPYGKTESAPRGFEWTDAVYPKPVAAGDLEAYAALSKRLRGDWPRAQTPTAQSGGASGAPASLQPDAFRPKPVAVGDLEAYAALSKRLQGDWPREQARAQAEPPPPEPMPLPYASQPLPIPYYTEQEIPFSFLQSGRTADTMGNTGTAPGETSAAPAGFWELPDDSRGHASELVPKDMPYSELTDDIKRAVGQMVMGNYGDDVTVLGTLGQIALGLVGLDTPADIRDIVYDFSHWSNNPAHIGQTVLDLVGLIPFLGNVKYLDEVGAVLKNAGGLGAFLGELSRLGAGAGMLLGSVDEAVAGAKSGLKNAGELKTAARGLKGGEAAADTAKSLDEALEAAQSAGKKAVQKADEALEGAGDSLSSKIYTPVEYKGTVKVNGEVKDVSRRVYQRNDIDTNYFDETTGLTNLERMQAGKPPIGTDGNPVELHHVLQQEAGPMAELRELTHQQYYSQLHGLVENGASFRNNPLLNKQYNNFRYNYWKWRASLITGGK
jgi:hypothetical protein